MLSTLSKINILVFIIENLNDNPIRQADNGPCRASQPATAYAYFIGTGRLNNTDFPILEKDCGDAVYAVNVNYFISSLLAKGK
jgi:hypothetical protein